MCRFRAGLRTQPLPPESTFPGLEPGPALTSLVVRRDTWLQPGPRLHASRPPSSSGRLWAGAGTPKRAPLVRGWEQSSAGSRIQSLN